MKVYISYSRSTSTTGRALAKQLGLTRNSFRTRGYGTSIPPKETQLCVNWGGEIPSHRKDLLRFRRIKYLNHPSLIQRFKNKLLALRAFQDYSVCIPEFWDCKHLVPSFPVIGRKVLHQGGSGFHFIESQSQLDRDNSDYWIKFEPSQMEYRVHVFNQNVIKVQRKRKQTLDDGSTVDANERCRSHNNGWYFSLCDSDRVHPSIKSEAIRAVKALGYDFGAVDVIRDPDRDKTFVLEVNSSPGLDGAGLEMYSSTIRRYINEIQNRR